MIGNDGFDMVETHNFYKNSMGLESKINSTGNAAT